MRNHSTKTAIEDVLGPQRAPLDPAPKDNEPRDSSGRKKVVGSCHVCYRLVIKGGTLPGTKKMVVFLNFF